MTKFEYHFDFLLKEFGEPIKLNTQPTKALIIGKTVFNNSDYFVDRTIYTVEELLNGDCIEYNEHYWYVISQPMKGETYYTAIIREANWYVNLYSPRAYVIREEVDFPYHIRIPVIKKTGGFATKTVTYESSAITEDTKDIPSGRIHLWVQNQPTINSLVVSSTASSAANATDLVMDSLPYKITGINRSQPGLIMISADLLDTSVETYNDYADNLAKTNVLARKYDTLQQADMSFGGYAGDAFQKDVGEYISFENEAGYALIAGENMHLKFNAYLNGRNMDYQTIPRLWTKNVTTTVTDDAGAVTTTTTTSGSSTITTFRGPTIAVEETFHYTHDSGSDDYVYRSRYKSYNITALHSGTAHINMTYHGIEYTLDITVLPSTDVYEIEFLNESTEVPYVYTQWYGGASNYSMAYVFQTYPTKNRNNGNYNFKFRIFKNGELLTLNNDILDSISYSTNISTYYLKPKNISIDPSNSTVGIITLYSQYATNVSPFNLTINYAEASATQQYTTFYNGTL